MRERLLKLLEKYNVPGPRYTSYPTVPAWTEAVSAADYGRALSSLNASDPLSLYFHLPFCEKLCHFCGCMKVITSDHARSRLYVDTLLKELDLILQCLPSKVRQVSQVHFGGGTPNFLKPEELSEIMAHLRAAFDFSSNTELAIEMHPRTTTREFCENLRALDFNRISIGVQDFDPQVQTLINRFQTYEMTAAVVGHLRELGFHSFNFDLIYGLPGQSLDGWRRTVEQVLALKPNRLAVYSYAHVPWVSPVQRSFQDSDLPSPAMKLDLFEEAYSTFLQNGYRPIGMDHFALADDELSQAAETGGLHRNFMGYSTRADTHQLGLGVSSISYVGGHYFQNLKELPPYETSVMAGRLPTFRGFLLNRDDSLRRDLITRIMCKGKVDFEEFHSRWGVEFTDYFAAELPEIREMIDDELVSFDEARLGVIGEGHLFLRNLAMAFDQYLDGIRKTAKTPTFSKTV